MTLTPETAALMAEIRAAGGKAFHELPVDEARAAVDAFFALDNPAPAMAETRDEVIAGPGGPLGVRVVVPTGAVGRILFCHGGGWVCGTAAGHTAVAAQVAAATGCTVAIPDYRRAPEHPFPAALQDCQAALDWLATGDGPLVLLGDSAGGNIAAVLARHARDRGRPGLAGQVLIYPVTDSDTQTSSYLDPESTQIIGRADMAWFLNHYCPDPSLRHDPDLCPLRAPALDGLPPAYVALASHDPLRDEGLAYAGRLAAAGVPVTCQLFPGEVHGFMVLGGRLASAHRLMAAIGSFVQGLRGAG